ncbi:MAG: hypothetical protein HYS98_01165 [Deltaproteobacteria bacterium]|nr:hypothetical protein [Deltaproteobacteria bacterium]
MKFIRADIRLTFFALIILSALALFGIGFFVSAPVEKLLGVSAYAMRGAIHGLFATVFMITVTLGVYQAARLWMGSNIEVADLKAGSLVNVFACLATIISGNWIYIPYRAAGGPREHFLQNMPEIHKIFFEFKEFAALFTFPLLVAAAYIVWRYQSKLLQSRNLRIFTSILLILGFIFFFKAFGLGAAITKLSSV